MVKIIGSVIVACLIAVRFGGGGGGAGACAGGGVVFLLLLLCCSGCCYSCLGSLTKGPIKTKITKGWKLLFLKADGGYKLISANEKKQTCNSFFLWFSSLFSPSNVTHKHSSHLRNDQNLTLFQKLGTTINHHNPFIQGSYHIRPSWNLAFREDSPSSNLPPRTSCCFKESSPARAHKAVAKCKGVKSGTASKVDLHGMVSARKVGHVTTSSVPLLYHDYKTKKVGFLLGGGKYF